MNPSSLPARSPLLRLTSALGLAVSAVAALAGDIAFTNALVIGSVGRSGRDTVHTDAIEARIVSGDWRPPKPQETVATPDGREAAWEPLNANADGWLEHRSFRGGYAFVTCSVDTPRVMILDAAGHNLVYANHEIRGGDVYAHGYVRLPVQLRAGTNEFLFQVSRGRLRARLTDGKADAVLNPGDVTLPDLLVGEPEPAWAAIVVLNASTNPASGLFLQVAGAEPAERFPVALDALTARKVAFQIRPPAGARPGEHPLELQLVRLDHGQPAVLDSAALKVGIRERTQLHRRTFLSRIDGSVQYFAVNPPPAPCPNPALFLSLHGAGVEAVGQAASYAPKSWGVLASPTNRRPFGFDWEEWGRWDTLEVLHLARQLYHTDPSRTYLTGHSMGGHGTWLFGATFPDQFAAIAPSAGWISFRTYARRGGEPDSDSPLQAMLRRAAASSDTLNLVSNYLHQAVYVLHGDADDNVPVTEARTMREHLSRFHRDYAWHEQPGAGHWWDASDEPGTDCVDWAPLFDLFARRRIPALAEARSVSFTTVNPGVSSECRWLAIEAQHHPLTPSHVTARFDPGRRRIIAQTTNVARLSFLPGPLFPPGEPVSFDLDGQRLDRVPWPTGAAGPETALRLAFEREDAGWRPAGARQPAQKNPLRYGPFREAFNNRMLFVYATRGTPEENAWARAKARFDAESFWYRGNGSVDVLPDTAFLAHPELGRHSPDGFARNVIVYGHADANAAWASLLAQSPVQVRRGSVTVGDTECRGEDLATLFLRPHPDDPFALVAVIAGSGLPGMRLTERLPVFLAGPGFPDCLVATPAMLTKGIDGIRAAGFFGLDWSVERGEFAWAEGSR